MKQAKVLTQTEIKRLLRVVSTTKHAARNRLVVMLSYMAGLRACEIAALKVGDVINELKDGTWEVKTEAVLKTLLNISSLSVIEISASGIVNAFSGGVTIIVGSQKRYFILLRPLLPTILTSLSPNSNVGLSLCSETTDRNLFKS